MSLSLQGRCLASAVVFSSSRHCKIVTLFHPSSVSMLPLRSLLMFAEEPEHVVLGILLGSREQEVLRMGPIILQALEELPSLLGQDRHSSGFTLVLPTLAHLEHLVRDFQRRASRKKGVRKVVSVKDNGTQGGLWDAYAVRLLCVGYALS